MRTLGTRRKKWEKRIYPKFLLPKKVKPSPKMGLTVMGDLKISASVDKKEKFSQISL